MKEKKKNMEERDNTYAQSRILVWTVPCMPVADCLISMRSQPVSGSVKCLIVTVTVARPIALRRIHPMLWASNTSSVASESVLFWGH